MFTGNSLVWSSGGAPSFFQSPIGTPVGSEIIGGDSHLPLSSNVLVPTSPMLLATLLLTMSSSAMAGQTATISLKGDPDSTFFDEEFNSLSFSSTSGTVTTAVPEPSSLAVWSCLTLSLLLCFGYRRGRSKLWP